MKKHTAARTAANLGGGYFEISPGKRKIDTVEGDEDKPILTLKPFAARPQISFKGVIVNSEVTRTLFIYNPDSSDATVEVAGVVPADRHLELQALSVIVPSRSEVPFLLTWRPKEPGCWCDTLNFKDSRGRRGAVAISYQAISPKKTKTTAPGARAVKSGALKNQGPSRQPTQTLSKPVTKPQWNVTQPLKQKSARVQNQCTEQETNVWRTLTTTASSFPSIDMPETPCRRETYLVTNDNPLRVKPKNKENYHSPTLLDTEKPELSLTNIAKMCSPKRQPLIPLFHARTHAGVPVDANVSLDNLDLTPLKFKTQPKFLDQLNYDFMFSPVVKKQQVLELVKQKENEFYVNSTFFEQGISQSQLTSFSEMTFPDLSFASRRCSTAFKEGKQMSIEVSPGLRVSPRELFSPAKERRLSTDTYVLSKSHSFEGLSGDSALVPVCSPSTSFQRLPKVNEVSEQAENAEQDWSIPFIDASTKHQMQLTRMLPDEFEDSLEISEHVVSTKNLDLDASFNTPLHLKIAPTFTQAAMGASEVSEKNSTNVASHGFATFQISPPNEKNPMPQTAFTSDTNHMKKPSTSSTVLQFSPPKPFTVPTVEWSENEENQHATYNKSNGSSFQNKTYNVTPASAPVRQVGVHVPVGLSQKLKLVNDKNLATDKPEKSKVNRESLVLEGVKIHDPDLFLYEFAFLDICMPGSKNDPFHLNPLLCESILLKYKADFTKWLNSVLTPPEELGSEEVLKVNAAELWARSTKTGAIEVLAPSRELVSSRYLAVTSRLDLLRRSACALFQQPKVAEVLCCVTARVESGKLKIRDDKSLHLNQGLKQQILSLFLAYNPLWLRIGLETVVGRTIPLASNSDLQGLSHFIVHRLLSAEAVVGKSHLLLKKESKDIFNNYVLKKFLLLVYFLDQAKTKKLIRHDPCLFRKNSEIKSSKDLLLSFSRLLLAGEGDVTRHLAYMGYKVTHQQSFLDEFNYSVSHIEVDLRDGVRITRVVELVTGSSEMSAKLRVPPVSRLQKVHNVTVALQGLKSAGYEVQNLLPADIVAGHREKTMSLLWQILHKFQLPRFENSARVIQRWWLHPSLKTIIARRVSLKKREKACITIQKFTRGYLCRKMFNTLVSEAKQLKLYQDKAAVIQRNFRTFLLKKRMAVIVQECRKIKAAQIIQRKVRLFLLKRRLKALSLQSKVQQTAKQESAALKIQSYWRSILAQKQLSSLKRDHELKQLSATTIQCFVRCFLAKRLTQKLKSELEVKSAAIVTLQCFWRCCLAKKMLKVLKHQHEELKQCSALSIQCAWRSHRAKQILHQLRCEEMEKRDTAAVAIQCLWRCYLARKTLLQFREEELKKQKAAVMIQCLWRCFVSSRVLAKARLEYKHRCEAAVNIQCVWRCYLARRLLKTLKEDDFNRKTSAVETLQRSWRCFKSRQLLQQLQFEYESRKQTSALIIQCAFRSSCARKQLACLKRELLERNLAAQKIQSSWRCFAARTVLSNLKKTYETKRSTSALIIQCVWRCHQAKKIHSLLRQQDCEKKTNAAEVLQRSWRSYAARQYIADLKAKHEAKRNNCALKIQCAWRCYYAKTTLLLLRELDLKRKISATEVIQCSWRCYKAKQILRVLKKEYEDLKSDSALKIQCAWRCHQARQVLAVLKKQNFEKKTNAAEVLQRCWRSYMARQVLADLKDKEAAKRNNCALKIQCAWRCYHAKITLLLLKDRKVSAVQTIQRSWRCYKARQVLMVLHDQFEAKKNNSAIKIQCSWRCYVSKKIFVLLKQQDWERKVAAARSIQCSWRCYMARQILHHLQQQHQAKKNACALRIQCAWRCHQARTSLLLLKKQDFERRVFAVETLQRSWRCYKARQFLTNLKVELEAKKNACALRIQCAWRCHQARTSLLLLKIQDFERKVYAVETLQRSWRCYKARQFLTNMKMELEAKKNACALRIQCAWRCHQARTTLLLLKKQDFERKVSAVETLQRSWRCYKARQFLTNLKVEQEAKKNACALRIQCAWRCHQARTTLFLFKKQDFERKVYAVETLQRSWRCYKARQFLTNLKVEQEVKKNTCALKIQCAWRCRQARYTLFHLQRQDFERKVLAAETIQRFWRCCKAVEALSELRCAHETKIAAAVVIQCAWRKCKALKVYSQLKKEQCMRRDTAALKIQLVWRCYSAKNRVAKLRQDLVIKLNKAATIIQTLWRCHKARCALLELKQERLQLAAVTLQCWWRCVLAQKMLCQLKKEQNSKRNAAAQSIQCFWRCFAASQKLKLLRMELQKKQNVAAVKIQCHWRCYMSRKMLATLKQDNKDKRSVAAVIIQCAWRCHTSRTILRELKMHKLASSAATCIQCAWRAFQAKILVRELMLQRLRVREKEKRTLAAVTIQKAVKKWMWRKAVSFYSAEKKRMMLSPRVLKAWEEILVKSPKENVKTTTVASILKEQHFIRQKHTIATQIIQRHWKNYVYKKLKAALKIQALWRGYKCRRNNHEAAAAQRPVVISVGEQELVIPADQVAKVVEKHERIQEVTRNAKLEDRIAWKIQVAINALGKTKGHDIYAMSIFETYLTISETCVPMILPALDYIVALLKANNRSVPAMEIAQSATGALLSLAKHPISQPVLWECEDLVPTLLMILKISKERTSNEIIFKNVCTILWMMSKDPAKVQDVRSQNGLNYQLKSLCSSIQGKQKVTRSQKKQSLLTLPTLRYNKEPRCFSTRVHGLHTLMKTLGIPIPT